MTTYLWMWLLMAGAFTVGFLLRGVIAIGDRRELDEWRRLVATLRLQPERDLADLERQWERS